MCPLADDTTAEFQKSAATSVHGAWMFQQNSDGGVLSGFPIPGNWATKITMSMAQGITSWGYVTNDGKVHPLVIGQAVTLQAFDSASACRKDCTVPKCGDGILDGGEVCDDGNKGGCSADCKAFK